MVDFEKERVEKLNELNSVIGKECSENFSPTNRAKLIQYLPHSEMCVMEVVESPYASAAHNNDKAGERYYAEAWRIWNHFFF